MPRSRHPAATSTPSTASKTSVNSDITTDELVRLRAMQAEIYQLKSLLNDPVAVFMSFLLLYQLFNLIGLNQWLVSLRVKETMTANGRVVEDDLRIGLPLDTIYLVLGYLVFLKIIGPLTDKLFPHGIGLDRSPIESFNLSAITSSQQLRADQARAQTLIQRLKQVTGVTANAALATNLLLPFSLSLLEGFWYRLSMIGPWLLPLPAKTLLGYTITFGGIKFFSNPENFGRLRAWSSHCAATEKATKIMDEIQQLLTRSDLSQQQIQQSLQQLVPRGSTATRYLRSLQVKMSDPNFPCDRAIFDAALATARREPLTGPIWWADQVMHHTLYMQSVIHILHAMKLYRHFKNKKYIRHFSEQMAALRGIDLSSTTNSHEALHNTGLTLHIPAEFALQEAALAAFNFTERSFKKGLTLSYNNNDFTISSKNYLLALFKVLKAHGYAMQMLEENTLVVAYHNTSAAKFAEIKSQLFRSLQTIAAQEQILEKVLQLLADTTTHNFSNVEFGYYKTIAADASMNFSYYINLQGLPNLESKAVFIQLLINKNFLNVPVAELVSDENNLIIFEQQHIQLSGIEKSAVTDLKAATPQSQTHRVERADDLAASSRQVTRRVKPQQQQEQAPAIPRPLADEGVELRLPNGLTFFSNPRRRADQPPAERVTPLTFPWHGRNAPLSLAAVEPRLYERLARDQDGRVVTQISNLLAGGVVRGQNAEGNCLRVALVETNDLDGNPQQCVLQVKSVTYNVRLFAPELPARVINQATQEQVDVAFYPFNAIGYGH